MKQKDFLLIIAIIAISALLSFFISKKIFVTPKSRQQQVVVVQDINSDFSSPDARFFNSSAFDPTKIITIGPNNNATPFKASQ
ncbi:MAG TPA: hypothetical protein VLF79_00940 [Candidatus Saccharimonadales bacterium]|nr:hypothetical protein [Candidatus Saccharimonadales bacterium]